MRVLRGLVVALTMTGCFNLRAAEPLPIVEKVDVQPLLSRVKRLKEAMEFLGVPLTPETQQALEKLLMDPSTATPGKIQALLDPYCLVGVQINPEMRVKVSPGPATAELDEKGWRQFLVKVQNESGTTAALDVTSDSALSLHNSPQNAVDERWLDLMTYDRQPLTRSLSGLGLEYRILQLYSRDAGKREALLSFNVGQGTQDLGYRSELPILFTCRPASSVTLKVTDENDKPTTAAFLIRDRQNRVYPSQAKRLAPDFSFHPQIYRADGEVLKLPQGSYEVEFSRGPESIIQKQTLQVDGPTETASFKVKRWIDPAKFGWWSGDHHIHAAGCAHYVKPTEGVLAEDMIRHVMGEDLKVGANLTWGPGFDYQKQFFCGTIDRVSQYPYLLRYDIEVSGFGSHESGHLCLLRLREQMYPGGQSKDHWPKLGLNTLRWAKKQGAVTGPAHSGWGLAVDSLELPNYVIPPFDGIGANEYIVDVTHKLPGPNGTSLPAVDFISTVDTPYLWELNIWYHTLNVGFRTRISGETDFPCIYGEKVGLGRSYVKLDGELDYDSWCEGIRQGRNYVSDGKSHIMDFSANNVRVGETGSELKSPAGGPVQIRARVASRLNEKPNRALQRRSFKEKPYWDVERARIEDTQDVPLELIVNGYPVATNILRADGTIHDVKFEVPIHRSSWVALRILPSAHSNPIFILVDDKPIRASRRSATWCLESVDRCWSKKQKFIDADEKEDAEKAYEHARVTYRALLAECDKD